MRKLNFLWMMLFVCCYTQAQTVIVPDPAKTYSILHYASSMYMGYEDDGKDAQIQLPDGSATAQQMMFEPVSGEDGVYYIKTVDGKYLHKLETSSWNTRWSSDLSTVGTETNAKFTIETYSLDENYVQIRNLTTNSVLGTDGTADKSAIYCNKNGTDGRFVWKIVEYNPGAQKYALEAFIKTAKDFLDSTTPGTSPGEYPQEAYEALVSTITAAQGIYDNPSASQTEVNNILSALERALASYKESIIPVTFDSSKEYNIIHSSGLWLAPKENGAAAIFAPRGTDEQVFIMEEVEGENGLYTIKNKGTGNYLIKKGNYNTAWGTDPASDDAKFQIILIESGVMVIKNKALGRHLGADSMTDGSEVYSDKGGNEIRHYWNIKETTDEVHKTYLESLIKSAESFKEGVKAGDYPQANIDAFEQALTTAKAVFDNASATQPEVNEAVTTLETTLSNLKASKLFNPIEGRKYRMTCWKYPAAFLTNTDGNASGAVERTTGLAGQYWEFIKIEGSDNQFIMVNDGRALAQDYTMVPNDGSAPSWSIHYCRSNANGVDYFGLMKDETNGMACSQGKTWVSQAHSHTNDAHNFTFILVDETHDPDKAALESYIRTATVTLNSKEIGTTTGYWPQAAYDEFNAAIQAAKAIIDGQGYTQEQVDAELQNLKEAETKYNNSAISVLTDDLNEKIEEAQELLNEAVVGEQVGEYLQSTLDTFETRITAAINVSTTSSAQEEVDEEVTEFTAAIEQFKADKHASVQNIADVLTDAITSAKAVAAGITEDKVGIEKGKYTQASLNTFNAAITTAEGASADRNVLNTLTQARKDFLTSVVTVDRSRLKAAIENAEKTLSEAAEGDKNGNYEIGSKDVFEAVINKVKLVLSDESITKDQDKIDAAISELNTAAQTFASQKVAIDFTALRDAITLAETAYNDNNNDEHKGEGSGQIPPASFETLSAAIDSAKKMTTDDKDNVNQAAVDAEVGKLNSATEAFYASRNPLDKSVLEAKIAEVEEGMAKYAGYTFPQALLDRFERAKTVRDNPNATQAEINAARSTLNTQWQLFLKNVVSIESDLFDELEIYVENRTLNIKYAADKATVSIFTSNGTIIKNQKINQSASIALDAGIYLVKVIIPDGQKTVKVIIK